MSEQEDRPQGAADVAAMIGSVAALSSAQNAMLTTLSESVTPLTVAEIAEKLGLHHNSVRETLDALVKLDLVTRHKKAPTGRGRPSWVYEATAPASLESFVRQISAIIGALTDYLRETADDPCAEAEKIGRKWGEEMMRSAEVPDQSHINFRNEVERLDVHTSKVRLFLSSMGYAATQGDQPNSFELRQCPLLGTIERGKEAGDQFPLACAMHKGLLNGILEKTSHGHVDVDLKSQVRPGACSVTLKPARWLD